MTVKQIYALVNGALKETLGETAVLQEDLSNLVEMGTAVFDGGTSQIYSRNLVNHIGKVVFKEQAYKGRAPSVFMDSWEFGSVKEKISFELADATENESWKLTSGHSYDPNVFTEPKVTVKYYNGKTTFEVPISITEEMVKQSFSSVSELNSLVSGIFTYIDNSMTIAADNLVMRTINNFIAETINNNNTNRYVKLLTNYKTIHTDSTLTSATCLYDTDFLKYIASQLELWKGRMKVMSTLFNIGAKERFTPEDKLHIVMLNDVKVAADTYLQSTTFHNEYTALPNAETVTYWQGSGTSYALADVSKINVNTADNHTIEKGYIAGIMFDHDALGVSCMNKRTTTNWNGKAEFTNYWFKEDAQYFNDTNENFVVFTLE